MGNKKSDKKAKEAFIQYLKQNGYQNAEVKSSPCDILAEKDGEKWYFEIKMTTKNDVYFGAATMTEWRQAFKTPDRFRFVIAIVDESQDNGFRFIQLTPQEMMQVSTIPPFKVYFNINLQNLDNEKGKKSAKKKALRFTEDVFETLSEAFDRVLNMQKNDDNI